jgi:DNA repair protein RecN (Recombination protein N)
MRPFFIFVCAFMLQKLSIQNYVIIDRLEIEFSNSLNIITGETGAGKSVLLGALSLILGQRADTGVLQNNSKKCIIEGVFKLKNHNYTKFFEQNELDFDENTIVRREINENGKSRAFINDTPVNISLLKQLGELLVNVHSQHETLSLNNPAFQTELVDGFSSHENIISKFQSTFNNYKTLEKKLEKLQNEYAGFGGDSEFMKFQLEELRHASLQNGEQEKLETDLKALEHSNDIKENFSKAFDILQQSENAVNTQLLIVSDLIEQIKKYHPDAEELGRRLDSVFIELKDIAETIIHIADKTSFDSGSIDSIQERLNIIYRLHKKHKTISIEELLNLQNALDEKLHSIEHHDELVKQTEKQLFELQDELMVLAKQIHNNRKKIAPLISDRVIKELLYIGMPNAVFKVDIEFQEFNKITNTGLDKIRFLFSANKGIEADELRKIASGGELSRLMLILKSLAAEYSDLPTLIFDEIDAGISGEIAAKVGMKMEQLASNHQVISITHLPQIASKGKTHFFVFKDESGNKTITRINRLTEKQRVEEIAKMLAGDKITDSALSNARELLQL